MLGEARPLSRRRVNHKRVEWIWSEEGLRVPQKQPQRKSLWLNDGSCIRLPKHIRSDSRESSRASASVNGWGVLV